jgi:hypothetical protein
LSGRRIIQMGLPVALRPRDTRHAAYLMPEYWNAPIDRMDWDARAVRS